MHNPKIMQMLEAVGYLIKNIWEIPFPSLSKIAMLLRSFDDIC